MQAPAIERSKGDMKLIIDRFEGNYAICEDEDRNMANIHRSKLPATSKEGDVLNMHGDVIVVDENETVLRKQAIKKMMDNLWE
jgi:hypothetical protein